MKLDAKKLEGLIFFGLNEDDLEGLENLRGCEYVDGCVQKLVSPDTKAFIHKGKDGE
jgi:hypothetical protein